MVYTIENEFLKVGVEDKGAQLKSILYKNGEVETLWQGDAKYWKGRAYNLFPIVGRLIDNKYIYDGKVYEMDRHGFARNKNFVLIEKRSDYMAFAISADDETKKSYPFDFVFIVEYFVEGNALTVNYKVSNVGEETMYFGLGAHPGFNVPFLGGKFEDYCIEFDKPCKPLKLELSPSCFISGKKTAFPLVNDKSLYLRHDLFDNDAIVLTDVPNKLYLKRKDCDKCISVEYPKMPFLGLWHAPHTAVPYVCIEPWENLQSVDGGVEDITKKENIGVLEPDGKYESRMVITLKL